VLEILLQERGLLESQVPKRQLEYFVAVADPLFGSDMYRITAEIRSRGHSANFSYKPGGLSKQLKEAAGQNAASA
jgi:histidyl-tRNA synthetase